MTVSYILLRRCLPLPAVYTNLLRSSGGLAPMGMTVVTCGLTRTAARQLEEQKQYSDIIASRKRRWRRSGAVDEEAMSGFARLRSRRAGRQSVAIVSAPGSVDLRMFPGGLRPLTTSLTLLPLPPRTKPFPGATGHRMVRFAKRAGVARFVGRTFAPGAERPGIMATYFSTRNTNQRQLTTALARLPQLDLFCRWDFVG